MDPPGSRPGSPPPPPASPAEAPSLGERFPTAGMDVVMAELDGDRPVVLELSFDVPLESLELWAWQRGRMERVAVPAEGEKVLLEWAPPF